MKLLINAFSSTEGFDQTHGKINPNYSFVPASVTENYTKLHMLPAKISEYSDISSVNNFKIIIVHADLQYC